jgi:riboflavin synthase
MLASLRDSNGIREMIIEGVSFAEELGIGDSVAVSGVCLTVTGRWRNGFSVEMMPETCETTLLGSVKRGYRFNLERSLRLNGRFEGHIVTGHVDLIARVSGIKRHGGSIELEIDVDPDKSAYIARKGSVAVQGVSLTVMEARSGRFYVGLIPKTLDNTTLGDLSVGSMVNIEFDILSKYIEALLKGSPVEKGKPLTIERLHDLGWA